MHIGFLITLLASAWVGTSAQAAVGSCADAYRAEHLEYTKKLDGLTSMATDMTLGKGGVTLTAIGCYWQTKSVTGCTLLLASGFGLTYFEGKEIASEIKKAEDDEKIYLVYNDIENTRDSGLAIEALADEMGGDKDPREYALKLKDMVDAGKTCKDGSPSMSWEEVLTSLR